MALLSPLRPPSGGVRLQQDQTTAMMDGTRMGCGTLYVADSHLSWVDVSGRGFSLDYPSIGLHAVSRDVSTFPQEHLYVMVNGRLDGENQSEMREKSDDDDDDDEEFITEFRFIPEDKTALDVMFSSMCECQSLHPDPEDEDSESDFEGDDDDDDDSGDEGGVPAFSTCDDALSTLTSQGQATLRRLEGMLGQSVAQEYHMAGVRTEESSDQFEDGMEVDGGGVAEDGQFEDADVDHWLVQHALVFRCHASLQEG
ncbi:methylosome subunit pICln [Pholidichthys leucotaenia]